MCNKYGHVPSFCLCFVVEMTVYRGSSAQKGGSGTHPKKKVLLEKYYF